MIIRLNENNALELTEKAFIIKDFRDLYNYYTAKLNNEERAMAAFAVIYYMHYFDSRFLLEFKDLKERFKQVKAFVYKGDEINRIKIFDKAEKTYIKLMDEEQTGLYVVMKANVTKLKEYAADMTLIKVTTPNAEGDSEDTITEVQGNYVSYKDFTAINSSLPQQEEDLRKFKDRLQKHFVSEVDVYGGGSLGVYED